MQASLRIADIEGLHNSADLEASREADAVMQCVAVVRRSQLRVAVGKLCQADAAPARMFGMTIGVAGLYQHQCTSQQWLDEAKTARLAARAVARQCMSMAPSLMPTRVRKVFKR